MVKDLTPKKKSQKELIVAAIELLRAKGFDINPYTVADEAGIPRSSLYRSSEFMELLEKARGDLFDAADTSVENLQRRISELEERTRQLEETIWNLEADNEKLSKRANDAFQEGFLEAMKKTGDRIMRVEPPTPPVPTQTQDVPSQASTFSRPPAVDQAAVGSGAPLNGDVQASPADVRTLKTTADLDSHQSQPGTFAPSPAGEFAPPPVPPATTPSANASMSSGSARPVVERVSPEGVFNAARSGPYVASTYNPLVELSFKDVEAVYHYAAHSLKDISAQLPDPNQASEPAAALAQPDASPVQKGSSEDGQPSGWQDPSPNPSSAPQLVQPVAKAQSQDQLKPDLSPEAVAAYQSYAYNDNYSNTNLEHVEALFSGEEQMGGSLTRQESLFPSEETLTQFDPSLAESNQQARASANKKQAYLDLSSTEPQTSGVQPAQGGSFPPPPSYAQEEPGAPVAEQAYREWQQQPYGAWTADNQAPPESGAQMQDSYDYGMDAQQQAELFANAQKAGAQANVEEARARGRATADKLQAFADPRDLSLSEPVVDLDELDIFDDLDDYVDLDKIDVIDDVEADQDEEALKTAGDELRELIKGRIKQASEIPGEGGGGGGARTMAAGGGSPTDSKAGAMGARNKFVGGKAQQQTTLEPGVTPTPQPGFLPKIPPDIRRHCLILGVPPEPEQLTKDKVMQAWKNQIASPGVHPDLGGDTEAAVALNTAKDALTRWLDAQAPKLGKKFGKPPSQGTKET
jgi:AcrR family transcriptional regulator